MRRIGWGEMFHQLYLLHKVSLFDYDSAAPVFMIKTELMLRYLTFDEK